MIKIFLKKLDELSIELHNYELNELKKIIEKKMKKKSFSHGGLNQVILSKRIKSTNTFEGGLNSK
jgi:hypothetical protein